MKIKTKNSTKNNAKNNTTELVFILDRSGSMAGLESDTIGGFNALIEKQRKEDGKCYVSTVLFDNDSKVLHDRILLEQVPKMTEADYTVRGCTAMFDAIGGAIHHIANIHKYARPEDIPAHTLFVITTDGMENASHRYSGDEVKMMIEREKKQYGWEFLFIGANIDSVETAKNIGIDRDRAVNYRADKQGTQVLYETVCATVGVLRNDEQIKADWCKKIDEDNNNRKEKISEHRDLPHCMSLNCRTVKPKNK